jgi:DNA-binding CsgD family transcriptional regulator
VSPEAQDPTDSPRTGTPEVPALGHRDEPAPSIVASALRSRPWPAQGAEAVLDKLNRGVVIFDTHTVVSFANRAARRLTAAPSDIRLDDGRLRFVEPDAQSRLGAFLERCRRDPPGTAISTALRIGAGDSRPHYRVLLSRLDLDATAEAPAAGALCVLMIYEADAGRHVSKRILRELYGLSEAESGLTVRLFEGDSLELASQHLHISVNTAKTHLHHVFQKCEVRSQGELLQLLSLGPRTL